MTRLKILLRQNLSFSSSIHQCLIASSCFSLLLLMVRIVVTGELTYAFLIWNLFLAGMFLQIRYHWHRK